VLSVEYFDVCITKFQPNTQHSRLIDQLHAATAFLLTTDY